SMSFKEIVARMATDGDFADYARTHVDDIAAEHNLTAEEASRLRSLGQSRKSGGPVPLGARLSKSGFGGGVYTLASHHVIQDHHAAAGTDPNAARDAEAASHHQAPPPPNPNSGRDAEAASHHQAQSISADSPRAVADRAGYRELAHPGVQYPTSAVVADTAGTGTRSVTAAPAPDAD